MTIIIMRNQQHLHGKCILTLKNLNKAYNFFGKFFGMDIEHISA